MAVCGFADFLFMPKTKEQKQQILEQIAENLKNQQSMLFVDYKGLGVQDLSQLRKQLKEVGAKMEIAKKTLLAKTFSEQGIEVNFKEMEGQIGVVYSFEDPVSGVKAAYTFAKGNENLKLLIGYMESSVLTTEQVKELAQLPSREQLITTFVGTLAAPIQGLVRVMEGNIKGLVIALNAIGEKKS